MRIRQVKPEFWRDEKIADLAPAARLTYIGLWMLADDAGWFRFDVPAIALELYGWDSRAKRERLVGAAIAELVEASRIVTHECGHAAIPTLVDHQRFAGETRRVYTIKNEHIRCSPRIPADNRASPNIPAPVEVSSGSGQGRHGSLSQVSTQARENDGLTEFQRRVPRSVIA